MAMAVGIDLGTTNSVVCAKKISMTTLCNLEQDELTPSFVTAVPASVAQGAQGAQGVKAAQDEYEFIVGKASRNLMKQYPEQTVFSIKRLMGREFDDREVQQIINEKRVNYAITTEVSEPGSIVIPLGGKPRTPEEISSLILKKIVNDGGIDIGAKIDTAVVTVPAYFSDRQKFATRAACDLAGLTLLRLLPEPTAAAISFGLGEDRDSSKTIIVFDLGGGTFDISILNISQGVFMEVSKGGDMWLGGDNIDHLLIDYVYDQVEKLEKCPPVRELLEGLSPAERARFVSEIKEKCESAKIQLSSHDSANIEMFGILRDQNQKLVDIDLTISRVELDLLISSLVVRLSQLTDQILREIHFEPDLIDTVLMVGGSSLIPAIQEELKRKFGENKVIIHPRPMTAVAEGAAWMAAHFSETDSENQQPLAMMHSVAHDYYLQLANGNKNLLVARNTPLPISVERTLRFAEEGQLLARLRVFNEIDRVLEVVGELWFHTILEDGVDGKKEELKLVFSVDEDNIISMEASSVIDPQKKVGTRIARGGLVTKLYSDLERTISAIVGECRDNTSARDAMKLSAPIAGAILQVSDPRTGRTHSEQKQKVQMQIGNLGEIIQETRCPLSRLFFAKLARQAADPILTSEQSKVLVRICENLTHQLESLSQTQQVKILFNELEEFWEEAPDAARLARAENIAQQLKSSSLGRAVRLRMHSFIEAYKRGDEELIGDARVDLAWECNQIEYDDSPTRRFDRDVVL